MGCWTDLPLDILVLIAQHVSFIEDFASFSAICKECRLIGAMLKNKMSLPPRYPRLMLAENKHEPSLRGFLNLLTSTTIEVELPEATRRVCIGAHCGWLFTLGFDLQIHLLHPFSRQQILLPPMLTLPHQSQYDEQFPPQMVVHRFVEKIAMSTSPLKGNSLNKDCVIVAIYGDRSTLAFTGLEDTVWTNIQVPFEDYMDVIYHKGKFYAIRWNGDVVVCDFDDNNGPKATVVAFTPYQKNTVNRPYLVESVGDLLLVYRELEIIDQEIEYLVDDDGEEYYIVKDFDDENNYVDNGSDKVEEEPHYHTNAFSIWRLNECHEEGNNSTDQWIPVTTLGDRALFVGRNVSTSKVSSDGIKANCIYFTDDYIEFYRAEPHGGGWDTGVVNIEDGKIHFDYARGSLSRISPPLWYI